MLLSLTLLPRGTDANFVFVLVVLGSFPANAMHKLAMITVYGVFKVTFFVLVVGRIRKEVSSFFRLLVVVRQLLRI